MDEKLELPTTKYIDKHRPLINNALHSAVLVSCGLKLRVVILWIPDEYVPFLMHTTIPATSKFSEVRRTTRRKLSERWHADCQVW